MRCHEIRPSLDLYVQQGLTPLARKKIGLHLSSCASCREELARLRRLEELLMAAPAPPVPEGLAERVVERARQEAVPHFADVSIRRHFRERLGRQVRMAVGTVAALVGVLLGGTLGNQTWDSTPRATIREADPVASSGLGLLVESGGDSLAQTYLALTTGGDG